MLPSKEGQWKIQSRTTQIALIYEVGNLYNLFHLDGIFRGNLIQMIKKKVVLIVELQVNCKVLVYAKSVLLN